MLLKHIKELKIIFYLHQITKKLKFFGMNYYIIQKKILHILQLIKYLIDTNLIILYFIILFSHINVSKKNRYKFIKFGELHYNEYSRIFRTTNIK